MIPVGVVAGSIVSAVAPGAPTSFSATAASGSSINLSWAAPSSNGGAAISSYTLKRGATTIYTGSGTSFTDTGLAAQTGYSYTVLATNIIGNGPTESASATTPAGVPGASSFTVYQSFQDSSYTPHPTDPEADGTTSFYWTYNTNQTTPSNNGSALQYLVVESSSDGVNYSTYTTLYVYNNWNYYSFSFGNGNPPLYFRVYWVNGIGAGPPSNVLYLYHQGLS